MKSSKTVLQLNFWSAALILLITFTGCAKKEVKCEDSVVSSLSFNYTGDETGTFKASGVYVPYNPPDHPQNPFNSEWTDAKIFHDYGTWVGIYANVKNSTQAFDRIELDVPDVGTGTFPLPSATTIDEIYFGSPITQDGRIYHFISGHIIISYYQCGRIKGTFNGVAITEQIAMKNTQTITVTEGIFDCVVRPCCN